MDARQKKIARMQLDEKFLRIRRVMAHAQPPKRGWVRAIRDSLGMSARQLGARAGMSQQQVTDLEKRERTGDLTMRSLNRLAEALGGRLVYAIVPELPLQKMHYQRAKKVAQRHFDYVSHSMGLEEQALSGSSKKHAEKLVAELVETSPRTFWDD